MRSGVVAAIALTVLARLATIALASPDQQRVFNSDSYEFHVIARNLLETGQFTRDRTAPFAPEVQRTPLQPAIMAGIYGLVGVRYPWVLVANVVFAAGIAGMLCWAGGEVGTLAAVLVALDPTSIVYAAMVTAETLFCGLVLVSVALLARGLESAGSHGHSLIAAAGLLGGLAVLTKPAATYLPLLLLPAAMLVKGRRIGRVRLGVVFLVAWLVPVGPWLVRNYRAIGIVTISSIQEVNLLYWNVGVLEASRQGVQRGTAAEQLRAEIEGRLGRPFDELAQRERLAAARSVALEHIRASPVRYAWIHLRGAAFTLCDPGRKDLSRLLGSDWGFSVLDALTRGGVVEVARSVLRRPSPVLGLMLTVAAWLGLVYAAAVVGAMRLWSREPLAPFVVLAAVTVAYLAVIGGPIGNARFRVPMVPYLAWFAAHGLRSPRWSD